MGLRHLGTLALPIWRRTDVFSPFLPRLTPSRWFLGSN